LFLDAVAVAVFVASTVRSRSHRVGPTEERIFRMFNRGPDGAFVPLWLIMQMGSLAAVGVATAIEARLRRPVVPLAAAGVAVWAGVKFAKEPLAGRGRPSAHLDDVNVRGDPQSGLGFPSGHAAVSLTIARIASVRRPLWAGAALHAGSAVAGTARMYVGAHLPLDVAAGWAVGRLAGQVGRRLIPDAVAALPRID
jgi:membrane-associated phospholipid phosphatase